MHDYAVFGHDRCLIGRWLGTTSILIAGGFSQLIAIANNLSGMNAFTKTTITTGIAYFVLHFLFNKYAWKIPFFEIPNLNGKWKLDGQTLSEDGAVKYNWEGEIGVAQNWKSLVLHLKTKNSQSQSYTATISRRHGPTGGWLLSYSYRNEPELEQTHELSSHKGYCEIEFDKDLKFGKASYFNSAGRRTFGVMTLRRELND